MKDVDFEILTNYLKNIEEAVTALRTEVEGLKAQIADLTKLAQARNRR